MIKKSALAIAALMMMYAPQMRADILTELVLIGGGHTCVVDVNTGNVVTDNGDCGGLSESSDQEHGQLLVSGPWAGTPFTVSVTANGGADSTLPTEQAFNQAQVSSTAGGVTLEAFFTDTFYFTPGSAFLFGASSVIDAQILTSTVDAEALYDAANGIPAGTPLCAVTTQTGIASAGSCGALNPSPSDTEYSLTTHTVISFKGLPKGGEIQANTTISIIPNEVPEPASIFLLGTLITGAVGLRQRSKRSSS